MESYITTREAALRADMHEAHISLLARQGKITGQKFGPVWMLEAESVAAYIAAPRKPGRKRKNAAA